MADDLTHGYRYPFDPASEDAVAMRDGAAPGRPAGVPGSYDTGGSPRWSPETIANVHAMAQLGRYQLRGYSTFNHRMPSFDDLVFVPATMTRLPLEGYRESCETKTVLGDRPGLVSEPIRLDIPIYIASMSFGALSASAKAALGHGASKVGSMTCTGEGGMLEEERAASSRLIYQMTPSRYMLDLQHLRMADGIELGVGQGAKPGTGGVLLGMKVSDRVARMRSLPVGVDQRATVRHPDFLGADDLPIKIEELREATGYRVPIFLKMGATRPRYDVAIAAKAGADVIVVDGAEGGTGASPEILLDHTGIPTLSAIRPAREALDECGMSGEVSLVAAGGIRSGADAAKCLALGADAVMIGTAALMALGCNSPRYLPDYEALGTSPGRCHHCHTGHVPGRDHDAGAAPGSPPRRSRRGRANRPIPHRDDDGDHPAGEGMRQVIRPQPGSRGSAGAVPRSLRLHRCTACGDRSGVFLVATPCAPRSGPQVSTRSAVSGALSRTLSKAGRSRGPALALLPVAERLVRHAEASGELHLCQLQTSSHPSSEPRYVPHRFGIVITTLPARYPRQGALSSTGCRWRRPVRSTQTPDSGVTGPKAIHSPTSSPSIPAGTAPPCPIHAARRRRRNRRTPARA